MAGEDSCGSTKDELKVDLSGKTRFGHRLTPEMVRRLRPTALRYIRTWKATKDNKTVTNYGLPHRLWDIRQTKVTLSLDTMSTLLITTVV